MVVVGLGGVGSHAAHMLLRSGVGKLRLIDFDQVTLSTLNRHCVATRGAFRSDAGIHVTQMELTLGIGSPHAPARVAPAADVGLPKATCLARHFAEIVPECEIDARVQMFEAASQEELLSGSPDYGKGPADGKGRACRAQLVGDSRTESFTACSDRCH